MRFGSRAAHRRALSLALPLIAANVTVPLVGAVDTAVLGHLPGAHYLGAAALGAVVFSFLYFSCAFLRTGTTGPVAQARGAGDMAEVKATLYRALLMAGAIGLGLIVLQAPIQVLAFQLLQASPEIVENAKLYVAIRIWGAPAVLVNFVLLGWFLGLERARIGLLLQLVLNLVNLALCLLFVLGFGWTIAGVAAATTIAEYAGAVLGMALAARAVVRMGGPVDRARLFDRAKLLRLVALNRDIFIRTLVLILCISSFTALGARFGTLTLAANAVLMTFQSFMAYALDGFANAAETLIGRAIGARDRVELDDCLGATFVWSAGVALAFALAYGLGGPHLIGLLTDIPEVRAEAMHYLPWAVLAPAVSVWSFQLDGVFWGAARGAEMRNSMLVAGAGFALTVWLALPAMGNHGLWLAIYVLMILRAITLGSRLPALLRSVGA
jgi:MATE family multidrug resistance protein